MERLTGTEFIDGIGKINFIIGGADEKKAYNILKLARYVDSEPEFKNLLTKVAEKLCEYEDLEEQGKLLRLRCKVGDRLYFLWECNDNQIVEMEVIEIALYKYVLKKQTNFNAIYKLAFLNREGTIHFYDDDFGKTVFFAEEEAKAVLEKIKKQECR